MPSIFKLNSDIKNFSIYLIDYLADGRAKEKVDCKLKENVKNKNRNQN